MKHTVILKRCLVPVLMMVSQFVSAQEKTPKEYQLKAVFLYNFTQFVTWPEATLTEGSAFVIGIVGPDPFGSYLDETIQGETMQGRPMMVQRFASAESVKPCHILFINLTDKTSIKQLSARAEREHMLTVGDALLIEKQGGMIRFLSENNKTKFRINLTAARNAGLVISSKLLNLAEIIKE